jgi:hypothetical protein
MVIPQFARRSYLVRWVRIAFLVSLEIVLLEGTVAPKDLWMSLVLVLANEVFSLR